MIVKQLLTCADQENFLFRGGGSEGPKHWRWKQIESGWRLHLSTEILTGKERNIDKKNNPKIMKFLMGGGVNLVYLKLPQKGRRFKAYLQ